MKSKTLKIIIALSVILFLVVGAYMLFFIAPREDVAPVNEVDPVDVAPVEVTNLALQVGPAITLTLDGRNIVTDAEGLDADGERLLEGLVVTGKEVSEALRIIAEALHGADLLEEGRRILVALNPVEDRIGQAELAALSGAVSQTLRGYVAEVGVAVEVTTVVLTEELAEAVRGVGLFPADYVDFVVEVGSPLAMEVLGLQKELGLDQTLFKDEFGTIGAAIIDMMEVGITPDNSLAILSGALVADPMLEELTTITAEMIDLHEVGATQENIMAVFTLVEGQIAAGIIDRTIILKEFSTITGAKADMLEAGISAEMALSALKTALDADSTLEELTTITAAMIDLVVDEGLTKQEALARIQAAIQADPTLQEFDELIEEPMADVTPPPITGLTTSDAHDGKVDLTWIPSEAWDFHYYAIYVSEEEITDVTGLSLIAAITDITVHTYQVTGLIDGQEYWFAVTAVDLAGNEDTKVTSVSATPTNVIPPPPITGLTATAPDAHDGKVDLTWIPSEAWDFHYYAIYVSEEEITDVTGLSLIATITDIAVHTYQVTGLKDGTRYWFAVTAVDLAGNEDTKVTAVTVQRTYFDNYPIAGSELWKTWSRTGMTADLNALKLATDKAKQITEGFPWRNRIEAISNAIADELVRQGFLLEMAEEYSKLWLKSILKVFGTDGERQPVYHINPVTDILYTPEGPVVMQIPAVIIRGRIDYKLPAPVGDACFFVVTTRRDEEPKLIAAPSDVCDKVQVPKWVEINAAMRRGVIVAMSVVELPTPLLPVEERKPKCEVSWERTFKRTRSYQILFDGSCAWAKSRGWGRWNWFISGGPWVASEPGGYDREVELVKFALETKARAKAKNRYQKDCPNPCKFILTPRWIRYTHRCENQTSWLPLPHYNHLTIVEGTVAIDVSCKP
jgi:flagellar basal body-associated protein FliL